jgi:hypothetical protein
MKTRNPVIFFALSLVILSACSLSPPETAAETEVPSQEENAAVMKTAPPAEPSPTIPATQITSEPNLTPTPTLPSERVIPQYFISASFDYYRRFMSVSSTVEYTNNSQHQIDILMFIVEANRYWDAFRLHSVKLDEGTAVEEYELQREQLLIRLDQPLLPGEKTSASFTYDLFLPEIPPPSDTVRPMIFGVTERQVNLVDWYPYIPPLDQDGGWIANRPWFYGEHQVYEKADFFVEINAVNPPAELTLAASSIPEQAENTYHFVHENARNFVFSASHFYHASSKTVGKTTITSYYFPFDVVGGKVALEETAAALELYNELFGEYSRESLSVVEADFLDGMEYDGLFFLSRGFYASYDGTPKGFLTLIAVHETAHQWWYAMVANDQANEAWLDEALSTYSELLFFERYYPELVDWWWYFRIHFHEPEGKIDLSIYDYGGYLPFRNAVYLKGAMFLDELRKLVGDEPFFSFLRHYVEEYQDKIATGADFFVTLRQFTAEDISPLKESFFEFIHW